MIITRTGTTIGVTGEGADITVSADKLAELEVTQDLINTLLQIGARIK